MQMQKLNQGFTLMEMLITLAVVSILAVLAAPNFSQLVNNRSVEGGAKDVLHILQYARTTAINQKSVVKICSAVEKDKSLQCQNSQTWDSTVIAFIDNGVADDTCNNCLLTGKEAEEANEAAKAANPNFTPDVLVRMQPASPESLKINACENILSFQATGNLSNNCSIEFTTTAKDPKTSFVVISRAGSVSISTAAKS